MTRRLLAVALSAFVGVAAAADFQPIEERMSARDFRAAGLDKLSAEELANLNRWINGEEVRIVGSAPAAQGGSSEPVGVGFEKGMFDTPDGPDEVNSNIAGLFDGWTGKTTFELENGQTWRQMEPGRLVVGTPMQSPQVTIKRGFAGVWRIKVNGYNSQVKVERIK